MLASFVESIKYVGHLVPVAFLRIYLGARYLSLAVDKFNGDFVDRPRLAAQIADQLPALSLSPTYKQIVEWSMIQHWQSFAFIYLALEFAVGFSYLLGYVVRPVSIVAAFLSLQMVYLSSPSSSDGMRLLVAIHLILAWVGAGRCLGLDYYFFKRHRGFWW